MADLAPPDTGLDPGAILIAEYEYIAQTAFQTNEDRSRVSTFYLVSVGSFIAAVFTTLDDGPINDNLIWAFLFLFAGLSLYGLFTVLQLARLRVAWFESAAAMHRLKEYYFAHASLGDLEQAFAWRKGTMPAKFKFTSITFLSVLQVAVLAAIMAGSAAAYYRLALQLDWILWATGFGLVFFILQLIVFAVALGRTPRP